MMVPQWKPRSRKRRRFSMPSDQRVHIYQNDFVRQLSRFYRFLGKPGRCDNVATECFLFFNNALELLDGRSTNFILGRVSLALYDHQAIGMDRKAVDSEVI